VDNNTSINLFHELSHGADANKGLTDSRAVDGIERSEWQASFNENIIRSQMNAPIRESYHRKDGTSTRLLDAENEPLIPLWYIPIFPINR
jgi:hypothetical protein